MGVPHYKQKLAPYVTVLDVLEEVRASIREGDFDLKSWDHNAEDYDGPRSNKRITIAGAALLSRGHGLEHKPTYEECKNAVLHAVVGMPPYDGEA